jgi:uncharacterized protein YoxC
MQKPDFRTISDFRKNNLNELKNCGHTSNLSSAWYNYSIGNISLDSKVMKANASTSRTYDEKELIKERQEIQKAIEEYLEKANQTDIEEDKKYGTDKRGNELPEDIRDKEKRIKKMKRIIKQLKQAQEKLKQSGKKKINLTDEDAQFQKDKSRIIPGYRAQVAVCSKEQIIVANDVTPDQCDTSQLIPMVDEICENVKELKKESNNPEKEKLKIIADSRYNSELNLAGLENKENIEPYIPDMRHQAKKNKDTKLLNLHHFI